MLIDVAILPKMVPIIIVQLIGWISFHFFMNYILSCIVWSFSIIYEKISFSNRSFKIFRYWHVVCLIVWMAIYYALRMRVAGVTSWNWRWWQKENDGMSEFSEGVFETLKEFKPPGRRSYRQWNRLWDQDVSWKPMDRMTEQESTSLRKSVYAWSWTAYSVLREHWGEFYARPYESMEREKILLFFCKPETVYLFQAVFSRGSRISGWKNWQSCV